MAVDTKRILKLLAKDPKYKKKLGTRVPTTASMRKQLMKVIDALKQMDKPDLAKKLDQLDTNIFEFFIELNKGFVLGERPTGLFAGKKKKIWDLLQCLLIKSW